MLQRTDVLRQRERRRASPLRDFLAILRGLWPLLVAAPVLVGLGALVLGKTVDVATRAGVDMFCLAAMTGPMGAIAYDPPPVGDRRRLKLFGLAAVWCFFWLPLAVLVMERYGI